MELLRQGRLPPLDKRLGSVDCGIDGHILQTAVATIDLEGITGHVDLVAEVAQDSERGVEGSKTGSRVSMYFEWKGVML